MNEIELILDECLRRMTTEGLTVERLLALYPEHAAELGPLLEAASRFEAASMITAGPGFKAEARGELLRRATARPAASTRAQHPAWRFAAAVAALLFFVLASTTAFAQTALPGEPLYAWKLESEIVWRNFSADPVRVDLTLAGRRADELTSVAEDPERSAKARDEFHEVLGRLEAEKDSQNSVQIDKALQAHQENLERKGIRDGRLDEMVKEKGPKKK